MIIIEAKIAWKHLEKHATKIIDCEKKERMTIADEENKSYHKQKVGHICTKKIVLIMMVKNIKPEVIAILLVNIEVLLIILRI